VKKLENYADAVCTISFIEGGKLSYFSLIG